jgi:hypothetical protein
VSWAISDGSSPKNMNSSTAGRSGVRSRRGLGARGGLSNLGASGTRGGTIFFIFGGRGDESELVFLNDMFAVDVETRGRWLCLGPWGGCCLENGGLIFADVFAVADPSGEDGIDRTAEDVKGLGVASAAEEALGLDLIVLSTTLGSQLTLLTFLGCIAAAPGLGRGRASISFDLTGNAS